jgi:hypothetical protein
MEIDSPSDPQSGYASLAMNPLSSHLVILCLLSCLVGCSRREEGHSLIRFQNGLATLSFGTNGVLREFTDRRSGTNWAAVNSGTSWASVRKMGKWFPATGASRLGDRVLLQFGAAEVQATLNVAIYPNYFLVRVDAVDGLDVEELIFMDLPLRLKAVPDEFFAACAVALNLQTNVRDIPGASSHLWAACYSRFGFKGASVALIGCPQKDLRRILQEVVSAAPELPHSPIGGPWALDSTNNRASYLFNFGDLTLQNVDDWIRLAKSMGIGQIDFHGGNSFRFGDCLPNPKTYPRGWPDFRAVIDRLHAAGLQAGLHTYAQFVDKQTAWVTPIPDPRLAKDVTFSLADSLPADASTVVLKEPTTHLSSVTGFAVRNSVTVQVEDELITYTSVAKEKPYSLLGCRRGAHGTRAAAHPVGAKVHHLKECFGLFVPDGDSALYTEVAAKTAEAFNAGGFDMIYLDALDGSDIVGGPEHAWHYQSKFAFEIWKGLSRPAIMEMSTFSHHLWFVRSRMGAWDHPRRAHKEFIDVHVAANQANQRMFLPGQLGWWSVKTWDGPQIEPTFPDDIEYLMTKCLGTDTGFALMGVDPGIMDKVPAYTRLTSIMSRYENLRRSNYFAERVKEQLRAPQEEFTLLQDPSGDWGFRRVQSERHKVEGLEAWSSEWWVTNRFEGQPLQFRLEALMSATPYDGTNAVTLADFSSTNQFPEIGAKDGIRCGLDRVSEPLKSGPVSGYLWASNGTSSPHGAWTSVTRRFDPPLNLRSHEAMGLWVFGDGQGQTLNVQLRSPEHLVSGIADHYIVVDFQGWRYFELVEPEARRFRLYAWPYGDPYSIYRESIVHSAISGLSFYYNRLPVQRSAGCSLSPLRALQTLKARWSNPTLTVNGQRIVFPITMESGSYLEFRPPAECRLFGPTGKVLSEITPLGDVPLLKSGANRLTFTCDPPGDYQPRAYVTTMVQGEVLRGRNK